MTAACREMGGCFLQPKNTPMMRCKALHGGVSYSGRGLTPENDLYGKLFSITPP
jgi:hypothetical protein